jgi:hypothetical protein
LIVKVAHSQLLSGVGEGEGVIVGVGVTGVAVGVGQLGHSPFEQPSTSISIQEPVSSTC